MSNTSRAHKDIIVGAASFHYADDGAALPTYGAGSARTAFNGSTDWDTPGFTQGGVEFAYEPDFGMVEVDQLLDTPKMFKQGQTASLNTTLAEATLANLLLAWGRPDADLTSGVLNIAGGALGDYPLERQVALVGTGPEKAASRAPGERVYYVRRALQVEASSHSLSKTENTGIPVSFRLLPDVAFAGAEYGTITDRLLT